MRTAATCLFLALGPPVFAPPAFGQEGADEAGLEGLWRYAGGSLIEIAVEDTLLVGVYVTPNEQMTALGFEAGDWTFQGQLEDGLLRGNVHIRYPLSFRESCPAAWDAEAYFEAAVANDGRTIEGRWREQLISDDCQIVYGGWVPLRLDRIDAERLQSWRTEPEQRLRRPPREALPYTCVGLRGTT